MRRKGLEPLRPQRALAPQASASANSATCAGSAARKHDETPFRAASALIIRYGARLVKRRRARIPPRAEIDTPGAIWYNQVHSIGMWLSLVERSVRDAEVVGSNPAIPTRSVAQAVCSPQTALLLRVAFCHCLCTDVHPMRHRRSLRLRMDGAPDGVLTGILYGRSRS